MISVYKSPTDNCYFHAGTNQYIYSQQYADGFVWPIHNLKSSHIRYKLQIMFKALMTSYAIVRRINQASFLSIRHTSYYGGNCNVLLCCLPSLLLIQTEAFPFIFFSHSPVLWRFNISRKGLKHYWIPYLQRYGFLAMAVWFEWTQIFTLTPRSHFLWWINSLMECAR